MQFLIGDTFTAALARLTADEQKAVKAAVFDLQTNPTQPGLAMHRIDRARDKQFWSARVNADVRLVVHRSASSLLLCYVDHHDKAYAWAERRKVEVHPSTGAAQLVEIRERVLEMPVHGAPLRAQANSVAYPEPTPLFAKVADAQLLEYGVPTEWLADVRAATEDTILTIAAHLPSEAAEALLELATGGIPAPRPVVTASPFEHPDAQRRFRIMSDADELARALDAPWDRWITFLHPAQRSLVERRFSGPARVAGSAGTGKTVVAIHRAVALARADAGARVLLTTFSVPLARLLQQKILRLTGADAELTARITVRALDDVVLDCYEPVFGKPRIATPAMVRAALAESAEENETKNFSAAFLEREWTEVVDAWHVTTWEAYRDVPRLGRKQRLSEVQRQRAWAVFSGTRQRLARGGLITMADVYAAVEAEIGLGMERPFRHVVVDEAQDVSVPQLRLLASLAPSGVDALFFAGDQGQRIFQLPFSWKALGVDVRGRSHVLRVNYRTSHQIRAMADTLLDPELRDGDGIAESRRSTVSAFNGPAPVVVLTDDGEDERRTVAKWLREQIAAGIAPNEIGVFVRSRAQVDRAQAAVTEAALESTSPRPGVDAEPGRVVLMPMHLAKGLEYRAVIVMCCDEEVLPLQERVETAGDESDLDDILSTERHLLYVACTRARDALLVSGVTPGSEFLADLA